MATATTKCNISFQIYYTSSIPATGSTASFRYKIKGSLGSYTQHDITSVPVSGGTISIPNVQASGEYEYILDLSANGVSDTHTGTFIVEKCIPPACEIPAIERVYLGENDQIIMDYPVDETDLYAIEYQIATDDEFTNIVHVRVILGSDYKPTEYIEMNDGTITSETVYYIRARRHCSSSVVSAWSNVFGFRSGKWVIRKALEAYCLPGNYDLDKKNICQTGGVWKKEVILNTPEPQVGSLIYLSDGITSAIPGKLMEFESDNPVGFNDHGIQWIRFEKPDRNIIYNVESRTGQIIDISSYCES
jgi:hypothetical protein